MIRKKELRNMLGKARSGEIVNYLISSELHRRGIVHLPRKIPMAQDALVILALRGSQNEKELEEFASAIRQDGLQPRS
jgi:hypothetical protein